MRSRPSSSLLLAAVGLLLGSSPFVSAEWPQGVSLEDFVAAGMLVGFAALKWTSLSKTDLFVRPSRKQRRRLHIEVSWPTSAPMVPRFLAPELGL